MPDAIWATLDERNLINLPKNLLVLYNTGLEELYCLNFDILNSNNEPKVTSYFTGYSSDVQKYEVLYDDFSEFLLDMVYSEI
ncbi:SMI1/KNR4 family protein [Enterococcus gilvus]|uniref:SMI1/KNR4 family protein n=1 Tax=Enterococcus gilvus TaxID=160453 RepID=UPI0028D04C59|nr:SMI1/KNR4 family protein [Enterococcus gilvus]